MGYEAMTEEETEEPLNDENDTFGSWFPPTEFEFTTLLFREFLQRLQKLGYAQKDGKVHVSIFRRYVRRLVDALDTEIEVDWEAFGGNKDKVWLTWKDIRPGVVARAVPGVQVNFCERLLQTLEDPSSSWLALINSVAMFLCIIASVGLVIIQSMKSICPYAKCHSEIETLCVLVFSFDFFARAFCAPFSRHAIASRDWHLDVAVPPPGRTNTSVMMTRLHRLADFLIKPLNIIDFVAILPFWVTLLVGNLFPFPLAFIRSLRLIRFLRVIKMGKFNTTLQVLGTTLARSTQSVYVLIIYVGLTCIMSGVVFNQIEEHENFSTVPRAAWWVAARMVPGMHKGANWVTGKPQTYVGAALLTALFIWKGMLWILPYAQIGNTFKSTWKENEEITKLRADVKLEDSRSPGRVWVEEGGTPTVTVEVLGEGGALAGVGAVPVPILEENKRTAVVSTDLWGGVTQSWLGGCPSVDVQVSWQPAEVKGGGSHGSLTVQPISGHNFSGGGANARYQCSVTIPLGLVPQQAGPGHSWQSGLSMGDADSPVWEGQAGTFSIALNNGQAKKGKDGAAKPAQHATKTNEETQANVQKALMLLDVQARQLVDLSLCSRGISERTATIDKNVVHN